MSNKHGSIGGHDIEECATIEAYCEGVPIYAFGYTYAYGVSPGIYARR